MKKTRSARPWYGHWGLLNSYGHWWVNRGRFLSGEDMLFTHPTFYQYYGSRFIRSKVISVQGWFKHTVCYSVYTFFSIYIRFVSRYKLSNYVNTAQTIDLILNRPLIAHLSLYTRLKPTCHKKIGIMRLVYTFNQWAFNCRVRDLWFKPWCLF